MPEEVLEHKGSIAVLPKQSIMAANVAELQKQLKRTRKQEIKDMVKKRLDKAQIDLEDYLKTLGR